MVPRLPRKNLVIKNKIVQISNQKFKISAIVNKTWLHKKNFL